MARPVYRRAREDDPNYPGTDKQTANEVGRRKHRGEYYGKGKTGRSDISKEVVAVFLATGKRDARRVGRARETARKYDGSTLGFSRREDEI